MAGIARVEVLKDKTFTPEYEADLLGFVNFDNDIYAMVSNEEGDVWPVRVDLIVVKV